MGMFSPHMLNIPESPAVGVFCFTVDTLCFGLFKIRRFYVQLIYSGFKVIEAGVFFTETSDYFSKLYGRHTYVLFTNCDI